MTRLTMRRLHNNATMDKIGLNQILLAVPETSYTASARIENKELIPCTAL